MKLILAAVIAFAMLGVPARALEAPSQAASPEENAVVLAEFTRSAQLDGLILNFVHLNNRTVELLFPGPEKYSMRARANLMTMIYVQGTPEKEVQLDTEFVMECEGDTIAGTPHNINNFAAGPASLGERIDGILMFEKKSKPADPFIIKGTHATVTFRFSDVALRLLGK